ASRRPARLPGGERAARRALRRPGRLGAEGHPQRGGVGQVLERPDDRRVRRRNLEREALYRDVAMAAISPLAGEPIVARLTAAPGNDAPIGGLKIVMASGWFAARPSGTENIYKIYAESFRDQAHLDAIVTEARAIVRTALGASAPSRGSRGERP